MTSFELVEFMDQWQNRNRGHLSGQLPKCRSLVLIQCWRHGRIQGEQQQVPEPGPKPMNRLLYLIGFDQTLTHVHHVGSSWHVLSKQQRPVLTEFDLQFHWVTRQG